MEAIQHACSSVNRYPDPKARGITKVLAERLAFPVGQIVVTNGSDQGISVSLLNSLEKVPYSTTQRGGRFMQMFLFLNLALIFAIGCLPLLSTIFEDAWRLVEIWKFTLCRTAELEQSAAVFEVPCCFLICRSSGSCFWERGGRWSFQNRPSPVI